MGHDLIIINYNIKKVMDNMTSLLRKYIKSVLKEIKQSDFETFDPAPLDQSTHDIFRGRYQGKEHFVKFPYEEMQTLNEYLAYRIYSLFDAKIPESFHLVFDEDNAVGIGTELFQGGIYSGHRADEKLRDAFNLDVGSMFYIDAFLANWDAAKNVVVNFDKFKNSNELDYRLIDPGGTMDFRAQGERKGSMFGDEVGELDTLLDPNMTRGTGASYVYGGRNAEKAKQKFLDVSWEEISRMIDETLTEVVNELNEHGREDLSEPFRSYCNKVKPILHKRHQFIMQKI